MSGALESVGKALSSKMIADPATRVVAQKIIEMAQSGVRGADTCTLWPSGDGERLCHDLTIPFLTCRIFI